MRAWIDNQKGVGYVVCWLENRTNTPLRNFGQMQSAAIEFRNWINRCTDERLPRWIRLWADTYNPADKYTYPVFTDNNRPTLKKQKHYDKSRQGTDNRRGAADLPAHHA